MDTSPKTSSGTHTLNSEWIIWYHSSSDKNWTLKSYKSILCLSTIEDLLALNNSWKKCLPAVTEGMYFIMRKLSDDTFIEPRWEDDHNKHGGYWSFKIENNVAVKSWDVLSKFLIGETLCENHSIINGISISPKKQFCIIKIWNSDAECRDVALLSDEIKKVFNIHEVKYSSHITNIKRDFSKIKRHQNRQRQNHRGKRGFTLL